MAKGTLNEVKLIGNLGRDPETRTLNGGGMVCTLSIGTDEGYKDKTSGAQVDRSEWHRVEAFGKLAEIMAEYLKKGSKVYICGSLRTDEYEKDGIKRYSTKIIADKLLMLDGKKADTGQSAASNYSDQTPGEKLGYQFPNGAAIIPNDVKRYKAAGIGPWPLHQEPPHIPQGF